MHIESDIAWLDCFIESAIERAFLSLECQLKEGMRYIFMYGYYREGGLRFILERDSRRASNVAELVTRYYIQVEVEKTSRPGQLCRVEIPNWDEFESKGVGALLAHIVETLCAEMRATGRTHRFLKTVKKAGELYPF